MQLDSRYCKILRLEWSLAFLLFDRPAGVYKLVEIEIPLPLSAVNRNTAECLTEVISQTMQRLPGLRAFELSFPQVVRMAVIDRYSANFKAERCLRSNRPHPGFASSVFSCDVHKASGAIKQGMALRNDTMSGLVNLALALEGSGMLSQMRRILQDIFQQELVIAHDFPPPEFQEHRIQVLDVFAPAGGQISETPLCTSVAVQQ